MFAYKPLFFFLHVAAAASQPWKMGAWGAPSPASASRAAVMAPVPCPRSGQRQSSPHPGAGGRTRTPLRAAPFAAGGCPIQDYVSQRLLPGLHMLHAAPGPSRQLPARRPVRGKGARCRCRCRSRCGAARRGSRGSHGAAPGRSLPSSRRGCGSPGAPPGAAPGGASSRCAPGSTRPSDPGHAAPGRQHAPRASLDAGGGQQPAVAGGGLGGGRAAHGLHVATQRGAVAGDLPGAGGRRLRAQRGPVPLQVEGAQAGFPLGAGDAPQGRTPLAPAATVLPSHGEHLGGGRAARVWRAEDARWVPGGCGGSTRTGVWLDVGCWWSTGAAWTPRVC